MSRLRFSDVVPYDVPSSFEALKGPSEGTIELPLEVFWGPQRVFDLANTADIEGSYQALVRDGLVKYQECLLNATILTRVWNDLALPARCRASWEHAFPQLVA